MKTRRKRPIKPIAKGRNPVGGLMADVPGGADRDKERRQKESRPAIEQMEQHGSPLEEAPE